MSKKHDDSEKKFSVGGLVGKMEGGEISNCHFEGIITISGSADDVNAGLLVGQSEGVTISNSTAKGDIIFIESMIQEYLLYLEASNISVENKQKIKEAVQAAFKETQKGEERDVGIIQKAISCLEKTIKLGLGLTNLANKTRELIEFLMKFLG